jgi:uncharacterized cupredoxin-like copper-binding protein
MKHPRLLALTCAAAALLSAPAFAGPGAPGHSHATGFTAGEPGDPKKPARIIPVSMKETDDGRMLYFPNSIDVKKNEQVRFVITNTGAVQHEFVLASKADNEKHAVLMQKYPDMEHDDPNGKTLQPKQKTELLWKFNKAGSFEFACLIPGHREAGMLGTVNVK